MDIPLVSIIVITYNSAKYVIETLESAKSQKYKNIELIVSDDCSTDDTIELCQNWIEENKKRFIRTQLESTEENSGIPANCNRGIKASHGEWIKLIAGDDLLISTCISDNVDFIRKNRDANFIFSNMLSFYEKDGEKLNIIEMKSDKSIFYNNSNEQHLHLVFAGNFAYAPTSFCNTQSLIQHGLFDEKILIVEDFPMWLKITKAGEKLFLLDKPTVWYRKHAASINSTSSKSNKYNLNMFEVYKKYMMQDAFKYHLLKGWHLLITYWSACYNRDKKNFRKYALLLSPIFYYEKFRRNRN